MWRSTHDGPAARVDPVATRGVNRGSTAKNGARSNRGSAGIAVTAGTSSLPPRQTPQETARNKPAQGERNGGRNAEWGKTTIRRSSRSRGAERQGDRLRECRDCRHPAAPAPPLESSAPRPNSVNGPLWLIFWRDRDRPRHHFLPMPTRRNPGAGSSITTNSLGTAPLGSLTGFAQFTVVDWTIFWRAGSGI